MNLDELLRNVAVVGAGGKMGRGIALLVLKEQERLRARGTGGGDDPELVLVDPDANAHAPLRAFLAGKLDAEAAGRVSISARQEEAGRARLVFEAAPENEELKGGILADLAARCSPETVFLTNTSSIPIGALEKRAGLEGRLVGFHFYNPPPVQPLVELVVTSATRPEVRAIAEELGVRLEKTLVRARDVAGFIGNGHFIREGLFAMESVARLAGELTPHGAVLAVDTVTRELLLRPMGIFRVIDYVGLDVFGAIREIMAHHLADEEFAAPLLAAARDAGLRGGQHADGSPRDGFFAYAAGKPSGVFSSAAGDHVPLDEGDWGARVDAWIGTKPAADLAWKALRKDPERASKTARHFERLAALGTPGAQFALDYLARSRALAEGLVRDGVAASLADVETVLTDGFGHLYGPESVFAADG